MKINNIELTRLMTTKEVASYFGISPETVLNRLIKNGLKYIEIGAKDYRYNIKDVMEFEESIKKQVTHTYLSNNFYNIKGKNYIKNDFKLV